MLPDRHPRYTVTRRGRFQGRDLWPERLVKKALTEPGCRVAVMGTSHERNASVLRKIAVGLQRSGIPFTRLENGDIRLENESEIVSLTPEEPKDRGWFHHD